MEFLKKNAPIIALLIVVAGGSFLLGEKHQRSKAVSINTLANTTSGEPASVDFSAFWKAWNVIQEKYVPASTTAKKITDQDKVYGAISGLASSLGDPYTVFFPPAENEVFTSEVRGNFEGVGMEVLAQNGAITVVSPIKGSPADLAGLKAQDKIIRINGQSTANMTTEDAVNLIRGPQGTTVNLTVVRPSLKTPLDLTVTRATINIPTLVTHELAGGIFKIDLYSFSENSPNLFRGALRQFVESGDTKLLLDLRGNPGGYLEAAIDMASWFLPSDKVVVREDYGASGEPQTVYRSRGYDIFNDKLKMAILVDGGSASASEILAGALHEQGIAKLVGSQTFGKGSVQELVDITPNTSLKVTVARWLTPNGVSISAKGITPDYVVLLTPDDQKAGKDPQLDKAIQILNQ